ncbi:MAG TPA: response regulator [Anaeromyxobacteraceae bacterium]|nr:response regulator [Anaeromyxobacteraceae bacterium]
MAKKKILLLDDSVITLEMEKAVLEERGYEVAVASNLIEFQQALDSFQPEVILTDLMMPDISGKDIVRVLKQDFHTERIPIVLFSSKPDEELQEIAEQAGADGFLSKSHGIERLGDMVDELVDSIIW